MEEENIHRDESCVSTYIQNEGTRYEKHAGKKEGDAKEQSRIMEEES